MKKLFLVIACALATACGGKLESRNLASNSAFQGHWLQKSDAEELRATGRLDSLCPELRRNPAVIINTRLIDAGGQVYAYNPAFGRSAEMLMGTISDDGTFKMNPAKAGSTGITKGTASIQNGVLTFVFDTNSELFPRMSASYLRSSEEEIRQYFKAQDDCRR